MVAATSSRVQRTIPRQRHLDGYEQGPHGKRGHRQGGVDGHPKQPSPTERPEAAHKQQRTQHTEPECRHGRHFVQSDLPATEAVESQSPPD